MTSFADAAALSPDLRTSFPEDWLQGRTAFGGLQAATALAALRSKVPTRPLRSASAQFVGPTGTAPLVAEVALLREGGSVTHARVDLVGAEGVACSMTAAFGDPRGSIVQRRPRRDDLPPLGSAVALPYLPGLTPTFVQHMDLRWSEGGFPFTGSPHLHHAGWCRHRTHPGPAEGALLALLDAWPSPAFQAVTGPVPASTVTWSIQLLRVPEHIGPDDWFYLDARVLGAGGDGFVSLRGELYAADGELVAHLEQLAMVFDRR